MRWAACIPLLFAAQAHAWLPEGDRAAAVEAAGVAPEAVQAEEAHHGVPTIHQARIAFGWAKSLASRGFYASAARALNIVERAIPRVSDHIALMRGKWLLVSGEITQACADLKHASESHQHKVQTLGRVGYVHCTLVARDKRARGALDRLTKLYPNLPERALLRLELARAMEEWQSPSSAANLYRALDIELPHTSEARTARERLAELSRKGTHVRRLSAKENLERAEKVVAWGSPKQAEQALGEVAVAQLSDPLKQHYIQLKARLRMRALPSEEVTRTPIRSLVQAGQEELEQQAHALAQVKKLKGRSRWSRLPARRLLPILRIAGAAKLEKVCSEASEAVLRSKRGGSSLPFKAAMQIAGSCDETTVEELLRLALKRNSHSEGIAYHLARSFERSAKRDQAVRLFRQVAAGEQSYYALWAGQGLLRLGEKPKELRTQEGESVQRLTYDEAEKLFKTVAAQHGGAYPSLVRAYDLMRLGAYQAASDELFETYQIWRQARGLSVRRAGLSALYRGRSDPKINMSRQKKLARRKLSMATAKQIARVSAAIDDHGTALHFGGREFYDALPLAHSAAVRHAARSRGMEPSLLFAIMRTESAYQHRAISRVGALGLTQIMPRTGRAIAQSMERRSFSESELLNPRVNLSFSSWYMSNLIRRFRGQYPLAIAAYNGGPHNVWRWLQGSPEGMPLDVFLENIPFRETHRYVRRVLTGYLAYSAKSGSRVAKLDVDLPKSLKSGISF